MKVRFSIRIMISEFHDFIQWKGETIRKLDVVQCTSSNHVCCHSSTSFIYLAILRVLSLLLLKSFVLISFPIWYVLICIVCWLADIPTVWNLMLAIAILLRIEFDSGRRAKMLQESAFPTLKCRWVCVRECFNCFYWHSNQLL